MSNHYDPTKDISPSAAYPEVSFHHGHADDSSFKKKVIRTTIILSIITVIELGLGLLLYALHLPDDLRRLLIKGVIIILSLAKAFYIVSIFMHLGDEIRNMILTIVIPLLLFIWFILAFILDGNSYKNLRNKYDKHFQERTMEKKEVKE
jgi:cytochrome c oxidase subunit IV